MNRPVVCSIRQLMMASVAVAVLATWAVADEDDKPKPQRGGDSIAERGDGDVRGERQGDQPRSERGRGDGDRLGDPPREIDRPRYGDRERPQDGDRGRPRPDSFDRDPPRGPMPMPPVIRALDRNGDGRVDRNELDMAIVSLRQLDRNRDGELSREELLGRPPGDGGRPRFDDRARDGDRPQLRDRLGDRPIAERLRQEYGRRDVESREGAQNSGPPPAEMLLRMLDRNNDQAISREEAPQRMAPAFERFDANGDGKLAADELRVMREQLTRGLPEQDRKQAPGGERPRRPAAENNER